MIRCVYCLLSLFDSLYALFFIIPNQDKTAAPLILPAFARILQTPSNFTLFRQCLRAKYQIIPFFSLFFTLFHFFAFDTMSNLRFLFTTYQYYTEYSVNYEVNFSLFCTRNERGIRNIHFLC